jgi:hypothetical protein
MKEQLGRVEKADTPFISGLVYRIMDHKGRKDKGRNSINR